MFGSPEFDKTRQYRLDNKLVAITGASDGIGLATAIECARRGASLLLLCRNTTKMTSAKAEIIKEVPQANVEEIQLDLADVTSVTSAIKEIKYKGIKMNILVLNAGLSIYSPECLYNINSVQVINHFNHFYLLHELLGNLKGDEDDPARVVSLSSSAHNGATGNGKFWKTYSNPKAMEEALGYGMGRDGMKAYCESKLANILHMREMATRHPHIKFMSVHPGVVHTGFATHVIEGIRSTIFSFLANVLYNTMKWFLRTADQGAQTSMYCICSPDAESWQYYADCNQAEVKIRGNISLKDAQKELWNLSLKFMKDNVQ